MTKIITPAERAARKAKWRGLGDVVAAVTSKLGIPKCPGCSKRQQALNAAVPFQSRQIPAPPLLHDHANSPHPHPTAGPL